MSTGKVTWTGLPDGDLTIYVNEAGNLVSLDADGVERVILLGSAALDSDLSAIASLSTTTFGRALLTLADEDALVSLLADRFLEPD